MSEIEAWGGAECTVNRVGDTFYDQLDATGHLHRADDFALLGELGLAAVRFPILWEKITPSPTAEPDWGGPMAG